MYHCQTHSILQSFISSLNSQLLFDLRVNARRNRIRNFILSNFFPIFFSNHTQYYYSRITRGGNNNNLLKLLRYSYENISLDRRRTTWEYIPIRTHLNIAIIVRQLWDGFRGSTRQQTRPRCFHRSPFLVLCPTCKEEGGYQRFSCAILLISMLERGSETSKGRLITAVPTGPRCYWLERVSKCELENIPVW